MKTTTFSSAADPNDREDVDLTRSMRRKVTWKAKKGNPEKISVKDIESSTDIVNVPKAILMLFNDHVEESIIGNSRVKCLL